MKHSWRAAQHRGSILASHRADPGSNPSIPKFFAEEKVLMLQRLINGAGERKVDCDLKMLIEPI